MDNIVKCATYATSFLVFERVFQQGTKEQCVEIVLLYWSLWYGIVETGGFGIMQTAQYLV